MITQIEAIIIEVEKFNDSIKDALNSKNISNTGEAARSLLVEHGVDFVQSIGIFYLEFLDTGRGPGEKPPFRKILEWAMQKTGQSKEEVWGLAVYVRDKIARLGTEIFRNNSKGLEVSKKIVTLRNDINKAVKDSTVIQIKEKLNKFKNIAIKQKYGL